MGVGLPASNAHSGLLSRIAHLVETNLLSMLKDRWSRELFQARKLGDMAGKQGHESTRAFRRRVLIIRLFEYGKV